MSLLFLFFFFNDTATTEIYTLSLHDALPIWFGRGPLEDTGGDDRHRPALTFVEIVTVVAAAERLDRKSTRLNSSHANISYAVFCLKKKKQISHIKQLIK